MTILVVAVAVTVMSSASSVTANDRRPMHTPILSGPATGSSRNNTVRFQLSWPLQIQFTGAGLLYHLDYPGPHTSCWLWRYNYLNWIC